MGRMGRFDCKGLKDFQQQLGKLQNPDDFVESCAKELAAVASHGGQKNTCRTVPGKFRKKGRYIKAWLDW